MNRIFESASKIVFIMLALAACAAFLIGRLDAKDFMFLAGITFTFYFSNKGDTSPYAGK